MNELASWNGRIFQSSCAELKCFLFFFFAVEELMAERKSCEVSAGSATRCLFICECVTVGACVFFMLLKLDLSLV